MPVEGRNNIYVTDAFFQEKVQTWPMLSKVFAGNRSLIGIDEDNEIQYSGPALYMSYRYWYDIVEIAADLNNPEVILGLRSDGTCVVRKAPFAGMLSMDRIYRSTEGGNLFFESLLSSVHSWKDIVQIAVSGYYFLALDKTGNLHYRRYLWSDNSFSSEDPFDAMGEWSDIRRILIANENVIVAQRRAGKICIAGYEDAFRGTVSRSCISELENSVIIDACAFYGGESMHYAFLTDEHRLISDWHFEETEGIVQLAAHDHTCAALTADGRIIYGLDDHSSITDNWPKLAAIAIGTKSNRYDDLFIVGITKE